jgi:peroxiredoxin
MRFVDRWTHNLVFIRKFVIVSVPDSFETACMELSILELFAGQQGYNQTQIFR